jgi:hypothetical protein
VSGSYSCLNDNLSQNEAKKSPESQNKSQLGA